MQNWRRCASQYRAQLLTNSFSRRVLNFLHMDSSYQSSSLSSLRSLSSSSTSPVASASERYSYNPTLRWNPQVEEYFVSAYGAQHFARISKALTCPSCYSCIRVNVLHSSCDIIIEQLQSILKKRQLQSDGNECKNVPPPNLQSFGITKCDLPGLDNVVFVKGSGPHTLRYGDIKHPLKEVIVSRKCAEAVLRGAQVFVPGVLACSCHVDKGDTVAVAVALEQLVSENEWSVGITRGAVLYGVESDPHYHSRSGMYIGMGTAMLSRAGMFRALEGIALELTDRVYRLPSFHNLLPGDIFLQNLPSIVAARVLDPQEGERILDMCAAPGGKTTAIAILMRDKGKVIAVDRSHNKVMNILSLAAEMGLTCIKAFRLDALKSVRRSDKPVNTFAEDANGCLHRTRENPPDQQPVQDFNNNLQRTENHMQSLSVENSDLHSGTNQCPSSTKNKSDKRNIRRNGRGRSNCSGARVETSKGFDPQSFDRVLLDAPCSALGLRPRLFAGEETVDSLRTHAKYQRKMFDQAVQLVRPGGVLVYSTCTINPGENEALVRYALDTYKFVSLAPQYPRIGDPGLVGGCELFGGTLVENWLTPNESELVQRFDPSSSLDTIGFFIAKFIVGDRHL